jgi:hypothetical protein
MTEDPGNNSLTVTLSPAPSSTETLTFQQSDSLGTFNNSTVDVGTSGTATYTQPVTIGSGSLTVNSLSTGDGGTLATSDYDAAYPSASDTTSFAMGQTTTSGSFVGSWSWSDPTDGGNCLAKDSGTFTAQLTSTSTAISGTVSLSGINCYDTSACQVTSTDIESGPLTGTLNGTTLTFTTTVGASPALTFSGTGVSQARRSKPRSSDRPVARV